MANFSFFFPVRIRLIPTIIFCLFLLLGVKIGTFCTLFKEENPPASLLNSAHAQNPSPSPSASPLPSPSSSPAPDRTTPMTDPPKRTPFDLLNLSPQEIELLQNLLVRRDTLMQREQEVGKRENLVKAAETRMDQKLKELKDLRGTLEGLLNQYHEKSQEEVTHLVKIYEAMKPKEAARIFEALDLPVLLEIIGNMKDAKSSAILAEMPTEKAKEVTSRLLQRHTLPK